MALIQPEPSPIARLAEGRSTPSLARRATPLATKIAPTARPAIPTTAVSSRSAAIASPRPATPRPVATAQTTTTQTVAPAGDHLVIGAGLSALRRTVDPTAPASTAAPTAPAPTSAPAGASVSAGGCRSGDPPAARTSQSLVVDHGPAGCNSVALTFDAGADRGKAEQILDTLRRYNVTASFGMTGQWAERNADLVQRLVRDGHQLINHTWSHRSFTGRSTSSRPLTQAERSAELERTESLLQGLVGRGGQPLFRPPYGDLDPGVLQDAAAAGYRYTIMWTVDSLGWNHLATPAIVERCLGKAEPGAIYVFHVGAESADAEALGPIIEGLRARGFTFVTISGLLGL
jgi:peptidoglycan-N-acetylglucosamine deacetylase